MSSGGWRINPLAGCLIGISLLLFGAPLIQKLSGAESGYPSAAYQHGKAYQVAPQFADPARQSQSANADAEARQEQRDVDDLRAQENMSFWAGMMFWVTSAGVLFVALTLNETRKATTAAISAASATKEAADIARDIGRKQVRAYLSLGEAEFRPVETTNPGESEPTTRLRFRTDVRNTGQSVAKRLEITIQGRIGFEGEERCRFGRTFPLIDIAGDSEERPVDDVPYDLDIVVPLDDLLEVPGTELIVFVTVVGLDVFKDPLEKVFRGYRYLSGDHYRRGEWNPLEPSGWRPNNEVVDQED